MTVRIGLGVAALAACVMAGCGSGSSSSSSTTATASASHVRLSAPAARHVKEVRVPDIVGERFGQAVKEVERLGLDQEAPHFTGTVGNPHYNGHCQRVLNQSPPPGTKVPKGYTVAIVYGVCPKAIIHGQSSTTDPTKR
ncbi:MAG: PASTA domain-containing protein [Solirubrobacterales bacterium]